MDAFALILALFMLLRRAPLPAPPRLSAAPAPLSGRGAGLRRRFGPAVRGHAQFAAADAERRLLAAQNRELGESRDQDGSVLRALAPVAEKLTAVQQQVSPAGTGPAGAVRPAGPAAAGGARCPMSSCCAPRMRWNRRCGPTARAASGARSSCAGWWKRPACCGTSISMSRSIVAGARTGRRPARPRGAAARRTSCSWSTRRSRWRPTLRPRSSAAASGSRSRQRPRSAGAPGSPCQGPEGPCGCPGTKKYWDISGQLPGAGGLLPAGGVDPGRRPRGGPGPAGLCPVQERGPGLPRDPAGGAEIGGVHVAAGCADGQRPGALRTRPAALRADGHARRERHQAGVLAEDLGGALQLHGRDA